MVGKFLLELLQTFGSKNKIQVHPFKGWWVWAKPTNTLSLQKILIAKQLAVWRFKHKGESLIIAIATQKAIILYIY